VTRRRTLSALLTDVVRCPHCLSLAFEAEVVGGRCPRCDLADRLADDGEAMDLMFGRPCSPFPNPQPFPVDRAAVERVVWSVSTP